MTVIVAVRTGAAAVLAADSKLTTQGIAGKNPDGTPRYLPQTYDHALKICSDLTGTAIAAFAGHGAIGPQTVSDYFSRVEATLDIEAQFQDARIQELANDMVEARRGFFQKIGIAFEQAPQTTILLAAPPVGAVAPRVWRLDLIGAGVQVQEILQAGGVWLEGNAGSTLTLLYGTNPQIMEELQKALGVDSTVFQSALASQHHLCAVAQINFWTMPIQDAMDFAVFCASTEIEMERFLPGIAVCGGPIDLMTLEMAPKPHIRSFPGKSLHHPVPVPR
jgi:hypothetical protein